MTRGGWCIGDVRGTYGCEMWKSIRARAEKFFGQVVHDVGEVHCIRFWYYPWSGNPILKDMFLDLFACSQSKEA